AAGHDDRQCDGGHQACGHVDGPVAGQPAHGRPGRRRPAGPPARPHRGQAGAPAAGGGGAAGPVAARRPRAGPGEVRARSGRPASGHRRWNRAPGAVARRWLADRPEAPVVTWLEDLVRLPGHMIETTNILLTTDDAVIGATPKDVVWTHRKTTLYRYRSTQRRHPVPVLLVFALINRPDIFDLRPGHSFVEYLLSEGFDVFLVDWGVPGDEDDDMGLANYVCDELHWAIRETRRAAGSEELSLVRCCIGATLCAMYAALHPDGPVRNLVLLTMPVDTSDSLYTTWVGRDSFDVDQVTDTYPAVPGASIDWANKLMKPVTNYWTTPRRLFDSVRAGTANRTAY